MTLSVPLGVGEVISRAAEFFQQEKVTRSGAGEIKRRQRAEAASTASRVDQISFKSSGSDMQAGLIKRNTALAVAYSA